MKNIMMGLALVIVLICGLPFLLFMGVISAMFGSDESKAEEPPPVYLIPEEYVAEVRAAGKECEYIDAALLAAHIDVESSWKKDHKGENGAEGLAQFTKDEWSGDVEMEVKFRGRDFDEDGDDHFSDPEDSIFGLARLECELLQIFLERVEGKIGMQALPILSLAWHRCRLQCDGFDFSEKDSKYVEKIQQRYKGYTWLNTDEPPPAHGTEPVSNGEWMLPTQGYSITSGFRTAGRPDHAGIDVGAPRGAPIFAASNGKVVVSTCNSSIGCHKDGGVNVSGCGWYVAIDHGGGYVTRYCHMDKQPLVNVGDTVTIGQKLGVVGSTGNSTGPHLHFEVRKNQSAVNPITFYKSRGLDVA